MFPFLMLSVREFIFSEKVGETSPFFISGVVFVVSGCFGVFRLLFQ
jgi:hypothetical protein